MNPTNGVLAMVGDTSLREEVDRVAAAAGVRVVHSAGVPSRTAWTGAAAVVLDEESARRCAGSALPRRTGVILVSGSEPSDSTWEAAISVGAQHVTALPRHETELVAELSDAAESTRVDRRAGGVVAVIAGRGGAGASLFAAALSLSAPEPLLVDVDPWGGGIDLVLGSEAESGLRWPDLTLESGRLNLAALRQALPGHRGISVLSGSRIGVEIDAGPLHAVIDAGRRGGATVICDLPRRSSAAVETALDAADLVVVITQCDVRACAATAAIAPALSAINPNVGLVVRGPSPGGLRSTEVAEIAGLPLLASMRAEPHLAESLERGGLRLRRRSPLAAAARRVLNTLQMHPAADAA
jgi:secretion/DNA translocation related CpaE-like protein